MKLYMKEMQDQYWREFGARLRQVRERLGLSEEAAAADLRVSLPTYRRWEAGERARPRTVHVADFCTKHNISMDWFFVGDLCRSPMFKAKPNGNVVQFPAWKARQSKEAPRCIMIDGLRDELAAMAPDKQIACMEVLQAVVTRFQETQP